MSTRHICVIGAILFAAIVQANSAGAAELEGAPPSSSTSLIRGGVYWGLTGGQADHRLFIVPSPTFGGNLGLRLNETTSLYLRGHVATLIFVSQASASLVLEGDLTPHWAIGGGLGIDAMDVLRLREFRLCWSNCQPYDDSNDEWVGLSVPVLLTYSFRDTVRSSWRMTLEGALGTDPRQLTEVGSHASLLVGYQWL
jgi:hypothetical protein